MRVIAEQKLPMDSTPLRFLRITGFSFDFNILLRCSSHSCALLQVIFQCRPIAVPKQNQNHFISISLGIKLLSLSLSLSMGMWGVSTRYAVVYSMVHHDGHVSRYSLHFIAGWPYTSWLFFSRSPG